MKKMNENIDKFLQKKAEDLPQAPSDNGDEPDWLALYYFLVGVFKAVLSNIRATAHQVCVHHHRKGLTQLRGYYRRYVDGKHGPVDPIKKKYLELLIEKQKNICNYHLYAGQKGQDANAEHYYKKANAASDALKIFREQYPDRQDIQGHTIELVDKNGRKYKYNVGKIKPDLVLGNLLHPDKAISHGAGAFFNLGKKAIDSFKAWRGKRTKYGVSDKEKNLQKTTANAIREVSGDSQKPDVGTTNATITPRM